MHEPNHLERNDRLYRTDFYKGLTTRQSLGFNWELFVQFEILDDNMIDHDSNPFIASFWKSNNRKKGVDSKVSCGKLTFGVECKYHESYANIYPSYIKHDYLPRFNDSYDYRIILTNDKKVYTRDSLKILRDHHVKVFKPIDFIGFYYRKLSEQFESHSYFFDYIASTYLKRGLLHLVSEIVKRITSSKAISIEDFSSESSQKEQVVGGLSGCFSRFVCIWEIPLNSSRSGLFLWREDIISLKITPEHIFLACLLGWGWEQENMKKSSKTKWKDKRVQELWDKDWITREEMQELTSRIENPTSTSNKHYGICANAGLQVIGTPYRPFLRSIQTRVLKQYRALVKFIQTHRIITVRQFYYHCISNKIVPFPKTSVASINTYQSLDNIITRCVLGGLVLPQSIADDTELLGTPQYKNVLEPLEKALDYYRGDWWAKQRYYIEVWLEKKALARTIFSTTNIFGVYLSVSGKYPSLAQIFSAKERFANYSDREIKVLYFGDLDPSGKDMPKYLRERLKEIDVNNVDVEETALNVADVTKYNLFKNPLKSKDKRLKWFKKTFNINYGVELDALEPNVLRNRVKTAIKKYLDLKMFGDSISKDNGDRKNMKTILDKYTIKERDDS